MSDRAMNETRADSDRRVLYRRPGITARHIEHFIRSFLRESFNSSDARHYDAVHTALRESGIQPQTILNCEELHTDSRIETINTFADALRGRLDVAEEVRHAVAIVVTATLNEYTTVAPDEHLNVAELAELIVCCSPRSKTHIPSYETYAARLAHIGVCRACEHVALKLVEGV